MHACAPARRTVYVHTHMWYTYRTVCITARCRAGTRCSCSWRARGSPPWRVFRQIGGVGRNCCTRESGLHLNVTRPPRERTGLSLCHGKVYTGGRVSKHLDPTGHYRLRTIQPRYECRTNCEPRLPGADADISTGNVAANPFEAETGGIYITDEKLV